MYATPSSTHGVEFFLHLSLKVVYGVLIWNDCQGLKFQEKKKLGEILQRGLGTLDSRWCLLIDL